MEHLTPIPLRTKAASIIRKAILSGELTSGQELSLTAFAQQLGISRTPVREAFQALESDGLITLRMNKGAIVNQIDEQFITDHYEVRILLESEAAARAARLGMNTAELINACQLMRESLKNGDSKNYVELNQHIHICIWRAANNRKLYAMLMNLWNGPSIGRNTNSIDHQYLSNIEHLEILESIERNDSDNARRGMQRHITRSMQNILRSYHDALG